MDEGFCDLEDENFDHLEQRHPAGDLSNRGNLTTRTY